MLSVSGNAHAGDSLHPRTPVQWDDVACMEFVDRSVEPNYALLYGIPYEDTDVTADEVGDSRTHQFFAICRQTYLQEDLPGWISMADVEETVLSYEDFVTPPDDDIFERATDWSGCWHRVNEDSDRRPITDVIASEPMTWDTSTVSAGVYLLLGYTYEPPFNLWTPRAGGVVRVHDGGDPAIGGPAAAISTGQQSVCSGETVRIEGCVSALPGTTMTAFFTTDPSPDPSDSTWISFTEGVPVEGDFFTLDWEAPPEAMGASTILRVDFTDPNGVTYTAYQYEPNIVLPEDSAGCAADSDGCIGGFVPDPACEMTDSGSTTDDAGTDSGTSAAAETDDDGCGCRSQDDTPTRWGLFGALALFVSRWRRR